MRVLSFLEGCTCSTGSLVFDPWFNSEDISAEVLEIPSSFLPVTWGLSQCHPNPVTAAGSPLHRTARLVVARKWLCIYLPVTFSTGLLYLISALPAVQIFPHYVLFPPGCCGLAALPRGTAGRSLSSQSASVSSSWPQQKPPLLPTEQHHPRAPSSL